MKQEHNVDESNNCWIILTKLLIVIDLHWSFPVFCERCSGKGSKPKRRKSLWFDHGSYSEGAKRTLKTVRVKKNSLSFCSFIDTFIFPLMVVSLVSRRSNFIFSTSAVEVVYWIDFFPDGCEIITSEIMTVSERIVCAQTVESSYRLHTDMVVCCSHQYDRVLKQLLLLFMKITLCLLMRLVRQKRSLRIQWNTWIIDRSGNIELSDSWTGWIRFGILRPRFSTVYNLIDDSPMNIWRTQWSDSTRPEIWETLWIGTESFYLQTVFGWNLMKSSNR